MKLRVRAIFLLLACLSVSAADAACPGVTVKFNEVAVDAQAQNWLEQELQKAADKVCGW